MKIIERGSILLAVIGFVLKILRLTGGNEFLLVGLALLAMVYFYLGFAMLNNVPLKAIFKKSSYSNTNSLRIVGAIGVGILLSIIVIGVLFKLLILAGSNEMLKIGVVGLGVTLFAAWLILTIKKGQLDSFYMNIFVRGGVAVIIGIVLLLTPASSLIRFYHRDDPAYAELYIKAMQNPNDETIQKEFEDAGKKKYK